MGTFHGVDLDELVLATERLLLRPWHPDDAPRVVEVMADPRMHEFLALPRPYTPQAGRDYVTGIAAEPRITGTGLPCAVVERGGGRLVGSALLRLGDEPEIGYWVAPEAQGRGYATEVTAELARWALTTGAPRVSLLCEVGNVASARVALAAGFRFEGVMRDGFVGGGYADVPARRGDLARFGRLPGDPPGPVAPSFAPLPDPGVGDGVLRLRPVAAGDADALVECDDELTTRWSFTGTPRSAEQLAATAARARLDWLVGSVAYLAMVDEESGRVAGSMQLRVAGPPQVGGVGYVVHPAFRGRGYATRALRLLAQWAFAEGDFARLELGAKVGNLASVRVAAAAGWEPDGRRRTRLRNPDGSFSDEDRFTLINPRYGSPAAPPPTTA